MNRLHFDSNREKQLKSTKKRTKKRKIEPYRSSRSSRPLNCSKFQLVHNYRYHVDLSDIPPSKDHRKSPQKKFTLNHRNMNSDEYYLSLRSNSPTISDSFVFKKQKFYLILALIFLAFMISLWIFFVKNFSYSGFLDKRSYH